MIKLNFKDSLHLLLTGQGKGSWSCLGRREALWLSTNIGQSSTQTNTNIYMLNSNLLFKHYKSHTSQEL